MTYALRPRYLVVAATAAFALAGACAMAHAADLTVVVSGVQDDGGSLRVGVYDKTTGLSGKPVRGQIVPAAQRESNGSLRIVFSGLEPGEYAVGVVHDRDGNGRLNMNLLGLPTEPYGFSGKRGAFGPPSFGDAALALGAQGGTAQVELTRVEAAK